MRLYGQESLKVSYQPAKFGGDKHFGSEDIMVSVSLVILEDHVIKGSCDYVQEPSNKSHHPTKFGGFRNCGTGDNVLSLSGGLAK